MQSGTPSASELEHARDVLMLALVLAFLLAVAALVLNAPARGSIGSATGAHGASTSAEALPALPGTTGEPADAAGASRTIELGRLAFLACVVGSATSFAALAVVFVAAVLRRPSSLG